MVSPLKDDKRAKHLSKTMHSFLSEDLKLKLPRFGSKDAPVNTFGAFLGILRASNPLFPQKKALRALKVRCPLTQRFPTTHVGILAHYEDVHVSLKEVIDKGSGKMDNHRMWRLILWIFLGNGGHMHVAWHSLKKTPCASSYRPDPRQPLEVLRWASIAVCHLGGVMKVIGSDGLDKKFRLSKSRFLWLCNWHKEVPALAKSFNESPESFHAKLSTIKGLKGDLTQKEILILLAESRHNNLRKVGQAMLPFGQGAKNGAKTFLEIPLVNGPEAARFYEETLMKNCTKLEKVITRLFPSLPVKLRKVTLGDIEPCLCGAFIYSKQVEKLRSSLPHGRWDPKDIDSCWKSVADLPVPAGFLPHGMDGRPEQEAAHNRLPKLGYEQYKVVKLPSEPLNRHKLLKHWGLLSKWPKSVISLKVRKMRAKKKFLRSGKR